MSGVTQKYFHSRLVPVQRLSPKPIRQLGLRWWLCSAADFSTTSYSLSAREPAMQFNVQTPLLSIGWSSTSSKALRAVASAPNGWLAAITVDSELLTMAPTGSSTASKDSGSTLCFSDSADSVVCAGTSSIDVHSVPDGRTVASLSELGRERTGDPFKTGAAPDFSSGASTMVKHPLQNTFAIANGR